MNNIIELPFFCIKVDVEKLTISSKIPCKIKDFIHDMILNHYEQGINIQGKSYLEGLERHIIFLKEIS